MKSSRVITGGQTAVTTIAAPHSLNASLFTKIAVVTAGVGLLTASAYASVPFYPVPLTMQTLAVLLLGAALGPILASASVMGYLALGALGAPVFHNGLGGLAVLVGPTAGYLLGFVPAAFVMGLAARRVARAESSSQGSTTRAAAAPAGYKRLAAWITGAVGAAALVHVVGIPWLAVFTGQDLLAAAQVGTVPFVLGDGLKVAVAVAALWSGENLLARKHRRFPLY